MSRQPPARDTVDRYDNIVDIGGLCKGQVLAETTNGICDVQRDKQKQCKDQQRYHSGTTSVQDPSRKDYLVSKMQIIILMTPAKHRVYC